MSLRDIVAKGVKIANDITKPLQPTITILQWVGSNDGYGSPGTPTSVQYTAVVEEGEQLRKLPSGDEVLTYGYIMVCQPITPNGGAGRHEPIDGRDIFVLPSGYHAVVIASRGVDDTKTDKPYYHEVWVGRKL